MGVSRVDAMVKTLGSLTTRRLMLGTLLGGALGRLGLADAKARKSGKCQPTCAECETCDKGSCKRKNGKKRCKKGTCKLKADGATYTTFPGGACQNGAWINLQGDEANCGALGTTCGPTQVCQAGACFPSSTCLASRHSTALAVAHPLRGNAASAGVDCTCSRSTEGNVVCVLVPSGSCAAVTPCTSSASCRAGSVCVETGSCCPGGPAHACLARCPAPAA